MDVHTSHVAGTVRLVHSDLAASEVVLIPTPSEDPADPLNWPKRRKYIQLACLISYVPLTRKLYRHLLPRRQIHPRRRALRLVPLRHLCPPEPSHWPLPRTTQRGHRLRILSHRLRPLALAALGAGIGETSGLCRDGVCNCRGGALDAECTGIFAVGLESVAVRVLWVAVVCDGGSLDLGRGECDSVQEE